MSVLIKYVITKNKWSELVSPYLPDRVSKNILYIFIGEIEEVYRFIKKDTLQQRNVYL